MQVYSDELYTVLLKQVKATPEEIAFKLKETIENEDYYNSLKENCKNERDSILSVETYADILIKEYEKLVVR